jgi:hypothetical protein
MQQMQGYTHRNVTLHIANNRPLHPRSDRVPHAGSISKCLYGPLKRVWLCRTTTLAVLTSVAQGISEGINRPPAIEINGQFLESSSHTPGVDMLSQISSPCSQPDWGSGEHPTDSLFSSHHVPTYSHQHWEPIRHRHGTLRAPDQGEPDHYNLFSAAQPLNIHAGHWLPQPHGSLYDFSDKTNFGIEDKDTFGVANHVPEIHLSRHSPQSVLDVNADGASEDTGKQGPRKGTSSQTAHTKTTASLFAFEEPGAPAASNFAYPSEQPWSYDEPVSQTATSQPDQRNERYMKRPPARTLSRYRAEKHCGESFNSPLPILNNTLFSSPNEEKDKSSLEVNDEHKDALLSTSGLEDTDKAVPTLNHEDLLVALLVGASAGALAAISAVQSLSNGKRT